MYLFRCATCETTRVVDTLFEAQSAFNEHAAEQHEIVLKRIDETLGTGASTSGPSSRSGPELQEADREGRDSP